MKSQPNQIVVEVERVLGEAVERLGLRCEGVLAAVSGGADSLALLLGLWRLGVPVEVACFDHGLRPEAAGEVAAVGELARARGLAFHTRRLELGTDEGVEAAARRARYRALEQVREARGLGRIATGHTASDQAETVLMRLGRGSALGGAAAILEARADGVVRPLLGVTRAQTRAYLAALEVPWADDPMNHDRAYTRVRVRHEVLPTLVDATGPGTELALARFAALAHEDDAYLQAEAKTALERVTVADGLDRVGLLSLAPPIRRRVLVLALEAASVEVDGRLVERALAGVRERSATPLPGELLLIAAGGVVRVERAPPRRG